MKLRTRVVAATLTAAMALQMPLTAFAQDVAAVNTENSGNIVIVDENGNQKTITPEEFNELNNADAAEESNTAEVPALTPEQKVEPEKGTDETVDAEKSENAEQSPEADATESQPEEAPPAEGVAEEQQEVAVQDNVIYWNPGEMYDGTAVGSDDNDGYTAETPVLTMEAALAKAQSVADQNGVALDQITVYMVNPLEVTDDKELDGGNLTLQAWDGRDYDSDVLFYMDQGAQLTLRNVTLTPRQIAENDEDINNKQLVWNRDGVLTLDNNVTARGSFVLDFCAQESAKAWNEDAELVAEKNGQPLIVLGEHFSPAEGGYHLWLHEQGELSRLQLVMAPYADEAQMNTFAAAFTVTASSETDWQYTVEREDAAVMTANDEDDTEQADSDAPFALFAVRAGGSRVYWNPGDAIRTASGQTYSAGDDSYDGSTENYAVRTLKKAIAAASVQKATIVCMQSVDLSKEDAKTILDYDDTTKTYRLAPEENIQYEIQIENWSATRLPIVRVADGTTLYIKNIAINSQVETESALHSGDQLIEVANKGCLQLAAGAQITGGYVGLTFDNTPNAAHAPTPIQVMDNTASANIYCIGIGAAPQWYATKLVTATPELIAQCGGEQATGEHLLKNFDLETANKLLVAQGGVSEVAWSLIQGAADADSNMTELKSLYLFTQLNYKYIYVDPERGDDSNLGITCAFPFKTLSKALAVVEAQQKKLLQMRTDLKGTLTKEQLDEKYPLPSVIYACSPIKVTADEQWDWSAIQNFADEAGELHTITLQAHEEPSLKEGSTSALHSVPNFIVQVSNGATLQMGKDVRIVRQLTLDQVQDKTGDTTSQKQSREEQVTCNRNAVNVIGKAKLVLQENATLMGLAPEGLTQDSYTFRTNPGNGIVVGTSWPTLSYDYPSSGGNNAGTLEIDAGWNGQLTGFGRGIYAAGQGTTVTMNGGTIEGNRSGQEGAGIYLVNQANFEMNGGTIQNNTAYYSGAGVYAQNYATVQINKGTIQKNKINIGNSYIYQGNSSYKSNYSWYVSGGAGLFARSSATITIGKENGKNNDCLIQYNTSNSNVVYGIGVGAQRASIVMNSGTIQNNYPDVSLYVSNRENGAGIGICQAKQLKILGGLIQNNGRQEDVDSPAMQYLGSYGGGIYVLEDASYVTPQGVTIKNVKISGNKACYGGGIYSTNYWANNGSDFTYDHKVLIQNVEIDSNIARLHGGGIYTTKSYTYKNTVGLRDVIVTNNRALGVYSGSAGGGIYGGFTWAKGLMVKGNSAETNRPINYTSQGGGICLTNISTAYYNGTTYYGKDIVMEDCVIESNKVQGQGGGIYNNSAASDSKSNRFGLTLTGTTRVANNTAEGSKGMGGGIYNNNSPLTLNAAVEWRNTAEGISANTNGIPAGSNIYTNTSDEVRLLQGTFVGNTSIVGYRSDTTVGKIVLDPTNVNFQPGEGGYAIHSENPRTQIVLLQPLPAGKALPISINHKNFQPGSLLVVPANVTEISTSALKENENAEVGGIEVDNTQKITYQNACKDASVNSSSISVSAQPSRAQFAPVPDTKDTTLTNMGFVGEGVYLDGENGDDSNTGLSPAAAVKTFDVAKQRLQTYVADGNRSDGFRPVIWVCGTVTISGDTEMTLAQADVDAAGLQRYIDAETRDNRTPDKVSVQRYAPMNDRPMFKVTDGTLTLKNIKLNGNAESVTAPGSSVIAPIVMLNGGNVNLNIQDGARLYNNLSTALVYVTNAKSITVNQTYATNDKDSVNDEKYGAQLDASQNKNGTVCSYLIYGKDLPQVVDITLSGTAWLNMAGPYFSSSQRSDANGIYISSGAGANVTLKDNAKISGITSSNGSRQYAVYIGSPTKKVAFLMQGAAEIQYVRYGLYLSNPRQGCTIEMRDTAEVQYVNSGLYLYGPYGNSTISLKNNANIKYATSYAIYKSSSGNADSKTTIKLSENAQVYTSAGSSYGIYVSDSYQNNKTKVDLINSSSVNGYSAGIYLEGSYTAAAITMSDSAYVNYLYDRRSASTARASLVMNDTAKLGRLYRYYMGSMDVTMFDQTQITGTIDSYQLGSTYGSLNLVMGREGGTDSPTIGGYISEHNGRMKITMYGNAKINNNVRFDGLASKLSNDGIDKYGIEMFDNAQIVASSYISSGEYASVMMRTMDYYSGSTRYYSRWSNNTPFAITLHDNSVIKYTSSGRVIGFYNNNNVTDTMGTDQTITLQDNSSLQGGGINGIIGSELAAGTTSTPRIGTVQIKDNAYVTSSYTTTMANAKYPVIQAQKVVLNNSKPIPAMVKDTSARDQWGCNVSIEADDLQLCGEAEIEGTILLTGKLDPNKNTTPITLTSAIPDGTAESKFRLQLRDAFMGLPVVQGNGALLGVTDASKYLKYFAMSVGLGDAGKMSLIANTANKTIDLSRPMNVYLSTNGDDAYDGSSPARAVRTFKRAKDLLQNGEGYGEGSDIIVPDTVSVQSGDTEWSFDEGGTLTNSNTKKTWTPKVRRNSGGLYTYPMISANMDANFHDITLDGGGNEVSFNTTMRNCGFSLLYIGGGTVTLGQNTVLTNVDYTQPSGTYFANKSLGGGFALTVSGSSTKAIMNGAVIENIKVNRYQRNSDSYNESDYYYNATYADVSIVSVRNAATLEMNSGAVRNNELQTSYNYSVYSSQNSQAIISVMAANFTLNGGEIEGNKLNSGYPNSSILKGIITVTGNSRSSSNYSTFLMSGGDVSGNTSLGSDSSTVAVGNHYTNYYSNNYNRSEDTRNSSNNFRMLGGTIRDNRSNSYPAMYIDYGYATMVGGMVYGNVLVDSNNNEVAADRISRNRQPIYVNNYKNVSRLILEGGGCQIDDGIYTASYPIIVSKPIRNTKRVYTVYPSRTNMGAVVVQPDGASLVSVAPYAGNFDIRVNGRVASAGKTAINVSSEVHTTSTMTEDNCIVLYKPVFVNGETGKDPTSINMNTGAVTAASDVNTTDLGRRPDNPVKTLDAAILIGQAPDSVEGGSWSSQHNTYLNYYIVYATGSVHNELYKGSYTLPSGNYTAGKIKEPNKVADNITYSMDTPAYMARYTGFDVITNSGETVKGERQYNYDHLLDLTNNGNVTLQNIEIYGRRLTDGTDKAGEALVRISDGVTLTMLDNTVLANNFANGSRPTGEDLTPSPMTMKGGAVRIEAGGTLTMAGGRINNTQATYGNAIYVDEAGNKVGTVMLQNKPQIDGSIYLVGNKTVVNADKSYSPASGVSIALQHNYNGREVAVMTDGTTMDSEHQKLFGLTDSIRALYEVKPKEDEPHKLLLFLKSVYYIDPNISDTVTNRDGMAADTAFKTLDELYDALKVQQGLNGVMVYVVNPITVKEGETVKLINASKTSGVVRKYYSLYTNILGETKKTETQVYFKRYVQPKLSEGGTVPAGFTAASNKSMIFDVQGTLTLKGIYLDGHSRELEDAQKNWTEEALVAEAPLVRVEAGGSLICDAQGETIDNINMEVAATIFTNSTNNKAKTQMLPTAPGIAEGCSAGLEILSDATAEGSATLQKAEFTNLVLDNSKETFVGGAAIYVNGKLIAGEQTFIEDTVYLEGQGKAGTDPETVKLQQTSRYITISKQGTPFNAAFTVLMRDAYNGRLVVRYPAANITIPDDNLSKYLLSDEVSRFYLLKEKRTSVNSVNYQDLCLYAPDAVYIDPANGNDNNEGFRPAQAVKTLVRAFNQIKASSGKVLYIMNEVPIRTSVSITHEDFVYSSTKITMPNTKHLMIRRYAKPDTKDSAYNKPDYLGSLFAVENGGELVLSGNVEVDGLCEGTKGDHIPEGQVVKKGIASKAALIRVDNGGQLYVGMNEDTGKPVTLKNNDNTATLSGAETANYGGALEIQEGGTVIMNGGAIDGNRSRVVPKTELSEQPGYANAIYSNGGTLIVARNPGGIANSEHPTDFICLDNGATMTMQMLLNDDEATKNLEYSVSVMDPEVGRDVVKYDGYTDVDAEHVHYTLDGTVPSSLFLVQAANQSNVLELQDWKFLNVEVPEEVFLGIHQTKSTAGADGNIPTAVRRVDVDGTQYADPEYTVTNKGAYEARVTVTSFTQQDTKGNITVPLVAAKADLNNKTDPKLYLALTKSSETSAVGNRFASMTETPLTTAMSELELGVLKAGEHGSFAFTGAANDAFMSAYMDNSFPGSSLDGVAKKRAYMRNKSGSNESRNNALAWFKLRYRIELATPRR